MALIKNKKLADDPWHPLELGADGVPVSVPPTGDVIAPLALWKSAREPLIAREGRLGVWLSGDDDPAEIARDLECFNLIAIRFAAFTDGRGYSIARLLRERYGWRGELRAIGDIQRDQLFYLSRCGFDTFVLRESDDIENALAAFQDFSEAYQTSVERPSPLFRRRETGMSFS